MGRSAKGTSIESQRHSEYVVLLRCVHAPDASRARHVRQPGCRQSTPSGSYARPEYALSASPKSERKAPFCVGVRLSSVTRDACRSRLQVKYRVRHAPPLEAEAEPCKRSHTPMVVGIVILTEGLGRGNGLAIVTFPTANDVSSVPRITKPSRTASCCPRRKPPLLPTESVSVLLLVKPHTVPLPNMASKIPSAPPASAADTAVSVMECRACPSRNSRRSEHGNSPGLPALSVRTSNSMSSSQYDSDRRALTGTGATPKKE
mmetsp:Transcript_35418/g.86269  ORF Transcript_35418/g.86269 Transcript_35418/m.86269 type:complete len:261 (-) Transcript_35418:568-1350(-)